MATQKRPLPATDIAKAETDRTLSYIFDDPYVVRAFENLVPGGGGGLSAYPKTWVLAASGGNFSTLADVQANPAVVNGDNIMVIGSVTTGALANLTKSLNFFLYPNAILSLPATISATTTHISGSMSASIGTQTAPALAIGSNVSVTGSLYLSNIRVWRGGVTAVTLTVSGATFSISDVTWATVNINVSSGTTTTFQNFFYGSGTITVASTTLIVTGSLLNVITRSGGTSISMFNTRINTNLNVTAASHTVTTSHVEITGTLTLPATIGGTSKLWHTSAATITAPSPVAIASILGIYTVKNANVSFSNALVNVVAGSWV